MEQHNTAVCGLQAGAQWSPGQCGVQAPVKGSCHMTKRAGSSSPPESAQEAISPLRACLGGGRARLRCSRQGDGRGDAISFAV